VGPTGPAPFKCLIIPALLVAVAVLQLYGQERNERYRKTADDAVKQQGIVLRRIADTVEQQGIEINRIGADLRRIADGIGAIASQEEETEGEDEKEDRDD
jgi:hypothetical protein